MVETWPVWAQLIFVLAVFALIAWFLWLWFRAL